MCTVRGLSEPNNRLGRLCGGGRKRSLRHYPRLALGGESPPTLGPVPRTLLALLGGVLAILVSACATDAKAASEHHGPPTTEVPSTSVTTTEPTTTVPVATATTVPTATVPDAVAADQSVGGYYSRQVVTKAGFVPLVQYVASSPACYFRNADGQPEWNAADIISQTPLAGSVAPVGSDVTLYTCAGTVSITP